MSQGHRRIFVRPRKTQATSMMRRSDRAGIFNVETPMRNNHLPFLAVVAAALACGSADVRPEGGGSTPVELPSEAGPVDAGSGDAAETSVGQTPPPSAAETGATLDVSIPGLSYAVSTETLVSNGQRRTFLLAVPQPAAATPVPLIIVLHADGASAAGARATAPRLEDQAKGEAVFAYLEAASGDTFPYYDAAGRGAESVFVKDVILSVSSRGVARSDRVFLAGVSGGATMTNAIACVLGFPTILGTVVMSGSLYAIDNQDLWAVLPDGTEVRRCAADPATQIQWGEADVGDTDFVGAGQVTRDLHRQMQGCSTASRSAGPAPCVTYDGCSRAVGWCAIPGMGHDVWSSGAEAAWGFVGSLL
jgi:polyhydroxybutyrate depolymerase